ncbi:MAG TPA: hypothetical protein VEF04_06525, partial [Blastocatellia bacterium]|nr:hypothetical protein [Blastocatellia bacterium]
MIDTAVVKKWSDALRLSDELDLEQSSLKELSEYFGISIDQARQACETALADSRREWETAPRESP